MKESKLVDIWGVRGRKFIRAGIEEEHLQDMVERIAASQAQGLDVEFVMEGQDGKTLSVDDVLVLLARDEGNDK